MPINQRELRTVIAEVENLPDFHYNLEISEFLKTNKEKMLAAATPVEEVERLTRKLHAQVREHQSPSRKGAVAMAFSNFYCPEYESEARHDDYGPPVEEKSLNPDEIIAAIKSELAKQ